MSSVRIRMFAPKLEKRFTLDKEELNRAFEDTIKEFFRLVRQEFEGSFWRSPSGSKEKWAKRRSGTHKLLIKTGRLLRGSTGQSSESRSSHTDRSFDIQINVPYAYIHRGGTSLSPTGKVKNVTPRRFATDNPEIRKYMANRVRRAINGKNNS